MVQNFFQKALYECLTPSIATPFQTVLANYLQFLITTAEDSRYSSEITTQAWPLFRMFNNYIRFLDPDDMKKEDDVDNIDDQEYKSSNLLIPVKAKLTHAKEHLRKQNPHIPFETDLRIKAFTHFYEKIWRNNNNPSKAEKKNKDLVGLRILLKNTSPEEYVWNCYDFAIQCIPIMKSLGFFPIKADEPKNCCKPEDRIKFYKHKNAIYIPDQNQMPQITEDVGIYIKDYILNIKNTGYQGLHLNFFNPDLGCFLEIQIKTLCMHDYSTHYGANHRNYKKTITGNPMKDFDFSIFNNIIGFRSFDGTIEHITDTVGLEIAREYRL